jgi:hypothetical protein
MDTSDVLDRTTLGAAMHGQDVVYANLAGDMKKQAEQIVAAMHTTAVRRLIFITSMGIYGEVPGELSLNSLSDLIIKLALTPGMESRHSLGMSATQGGKS